MLCGKNKFQVSDLDWRDERTPVSREFEDVYFSTDEGLEETRYVFLKHNGLPESWNGRSRFNIGELGFGTGLSFFATCELLNIERIKSSKLLPKLHFYSCEKFPLHRDVISKAMKVWPEMSPTVNEFLDQYNSHDSSVEIEIANGQIKLSLFFDEVVAAIENYTSDINAWYFDGFNPKKNPEMWTESVFKLVKSKSAPGATFSTYTSVGEIRRRWQGLGFEVNKTVGYGKKREMCFGVVKPKEPKGDGVDFKVKFIS